MVDHLKGKALTVTGPVDPGTLGLVLPHEHLLIDYQKICQSLPNGRCDDIQSDDIQSLTLCNIGAVYYHPNSYAVNMILDDKDEMVQELMLFKQSGGGTLCELTIRGLRPQHNETKHMKWLAQETGVNIICGTGFYLDSVLTDEEKAMSVDELAQVMIDEIVTGIPGSDGVRCGIIGEIGCSWPLTVNERKVLQAAAIAQHQTGAPLIIHPGRGSSAPFEIVDILLCAGADLSRTVMSHLDRTLFNHEDFIRFAETGCILEFDLFGVECSHYQLNTSIDMPSDAQRIATIKMLCDKGYASRVLISHDIHTKHRLVKYGGHGYHHIPLNILPKMRDRGITDEHIHQITVTNPKQWLTFQ